MKPRMQRLLSFLSGLLLTLPALGYADDLELAQEPLFLGNAVSPNLMFLLDDSGSMRWGFMPDELDEKFDIGGTRTDCSNWGSWGGMSLCFYKTNDGREYLASSYMNKLYYDPDINYVPPLKADGQSLSAISFDDAPLDGYDSDSIRINLSNNYRALMDDYYYKQVDVNNGSFWYPDWVSKDGFAISHNADKEAAFYYTYDSSCSDKYSDSCYSKVVVGQDEKQNFANWFSYYRTRLLASRAGISQAFDALPEDFRLGWGAINNSGQLTIDGSENVRAVRQGVRTYNDAHKASFYNWLFNAEATGSTPLRRALEGAGEYYEGSKRPWADDPSENISDTNVARECRQSYTILMTDGYYSGSAPADAVGNADNSDGDEITSPKSYKYTPIHPFKDDKSSTLADVAMHYWKRDLQSGIANYVPASTHNPAFWQHMVTYGVGLGVEGSVDADAAFTAIPSGSQVDWWGGTSNQDKINDLLHAAVNSRGGFFSAADPTTFATELKSMVGELANGAGSATAVEFDVSSFQEGALIFSAQFDSNGWTGDLKAVPLGGDDTPIIPDIDAAIEAGNGWSAKAILDERDLGTDDRVIITSAGGIGVPFRWNDNLTAAQKADLNYGSVSGELRLAFIRGDRSQEETSDFRKRESRLGSIVNSSPQYVGAPQSGWPNSDPFGSSGSRYSDYEDSKATRAPVIYVGANDGMLHGFDATEEGGDEVLAYVPEFVYSEESNAGLHFLADPDYQHRYYVDLSTREQDVYIGGAWRTILVGGGRTGAKGVFALDVTNPATFSEANADNIALWEFSSADSSSMGYTMEPPVISLARWGEDDIRWTAFVANGYNSSTATTGYFMLDIEGGRDGNWGAGDYKYIEFESGGNGLSPLTVLDTSGDFIADRVYAGDLDGNLWVANDSGEGSWGPAYTAVGEAMPLYDASQPITAAPAVSSNPDKPRAGNEPNLVVYFGTGKYLESSDVTSTAAQSIYGIWDKGVGDVPTDKLATRTITGEELTIDGELHDVRYSGGDEVNYSTDRGWVVNLPDASERVVVSPQLRGQFLYLNSMIPDEDPCTGGGSGWLMAFGLDGRTPHKRAFLQFPTEVTGYRSEGLTNQSTILGNFRFSPCTNCETDIAEIPPLSSSIIGAGRRGWHELIK